MKKSYIISVVVVAVLCVATLFGCTRPTDKKWTASNIVSKLNYDEAAARAKFAAPASVCLAINGEARCEVEYSASASDGLKETAAFLAKVLAQIFGAEEVPCGEEPAVEQADSASGNAKARGENIDKSVGAQDEPLPDGAEAETPDEGASDADVKTVFSLGDTARNKSLPIADVKDDGYAVAVGGSAVLIKGITDEGAKNGVYGFLEDRLEVMFVSNAFDYIPTFPTVYLKQESYIDNPTFAWRRVFQYETLQNGWYKKLKNNGTEADGSKEGKNAQWGTWCHNVFAFVDPAVWFLARPDFYAMIDGARQYQISGQTTQLCLTNPDIYAVIEASLAEMIVKNPDAKYWDFSINDNQNYCQCADCDAVYAETGSRMGTMLPIINRLAERFPDKIISTLAYFYNSDVPRGMTCRDNVNITIAPIATGQAYSYLYGDTDASNKAKQMIERWSAVCDSILVWDYTVNFSHLLLPYPNYDVQPLNHLFYENSHVKAVFHQGSREQGDEMAEFRSYLLSKQLWDREADWQALAAKYLQVYYGDAAPSVAKYLDAMSGIVNKKAFTLDLYDAPAAHTDDYLSVKAIEEYLDLISKAEQAVEGDETLLGRLKPIKLNILYAKMFEKSADFRGKKDAFATFSALAEELGVTQPYEPKNPTMTEFLQTDYPAYLRREQLKLALGIVLPMAIVLAFVGLNFLIMRALKTKKRKNAEVGAEEDAEVEPTANDDGDK